MNVTVKLFARLRVAIGKDEVVLSIDGNRVSDVLRQLAAVYDVKEILYDENSNVTPLIVVINNLETARITEANTSLGGLNKELKEGDVVSILEQGCGA
jgi:MoaD family protein